jgi:hypothetical protein
MIFQISYAGDGKKVIRLFDRAQEHSQRGKRSPAETGRKNRGKPDTCFSAPGLAFQINTDYCM